MKIVIDGNDGVGKSTLVRSLLDLGIEDVQDRGEMTLATDGPAEPIEGTAYILLTCPWQTSHARLQDAGKDMGEYWHQPDTLKHYEARFLEIAPSFNATVIESTTKSDTLIKTLRALGLSMKVGATSGRLRADLGFPLTAPKNAPLVAGEGPLQVFRLRSKTYPQMVALGALDVAVVGLDALMGNPYRHGVEVIRSVPLISKAGDIQVVVAGKRMPPKGALLRVASPFPEWAQQYFGDQGIPHTVFSVAGGTEAMVEAGVADVIFDVMETGKTIASCGLEIFERVAQLEACIIKRAAK